MTKKILLVEDDRSMRSLLRTLLEISGFSVSTVEVYEIPSITSAVIEGAPDAIIMDVNYEKQPKGFDFLKAVRDLKVIQQPYIIMSSGSDVRWKCIETGADEFLMKPYMPDDLINLLNSHFAQV